jgi:hypothetical protein
MEDKDKNVVFQPGAVVFQSGAIQVQSGANVQMGGTQTITQNFYNGGAEGGKPSLTTDDLREAIMKLKGERDKRGAALLCDKGAWYAVVRIGIDYFGFSAQLPAACEALSALGFAPDVDYESVRKVPVNYPALNKPFREWDAKEYSSNLAACQKQHRIAARLVEILGMDVG